MEGSDYPQSAVSPQSMDSVLTSEGKMLLLFHPLPKSIKNKPKPTFVLSSHVIPLHKVLLLIDRWGETGTANRAWHPRWHKSRSWEDRPHDSRRSDGDSEVKMSSS